MEKCGEMYRLKFRINKGAEVVTVEDNHFNTDHYPEYQSLKFGISKKPKVKEYLAGLLFSTSGKIERQDGKAVFAKATIEKSDADQLIYNLRDDNLYFGGVARAIINKNPWIIEQSEAIDGYMDTEIYFEFKGTLYNCKRFYILSQYY